MSHYLPEINVDRVAYAGLIRRHIDPNVEFVFVHHTALP